LTAKYAEYAKRETTDEIGAKRRKRRRNLAGEDARPALFAAKERREKCLSISISGCGENSAAWNGGSGSGLGRVGNG
jgi:hypothetical protein